MSINLPVLQPDKYNPHLLDGLYVYSVDGKPQYALDIVRLGGVYCINSVKVYTDTLPSTIVIPPFPTRIGDPFDTSKDVIVKSDRATLNYSDQRYKLYAKGYVSFEKNCFKDFDELDLIIPEDTVIKIHPQAFAPCANINITTVEGKSLVRSYIEEGIYDREEIEDAVQGQELQTHSGDHIQTCILLADNVKLDVCSLSEKIACEPITINEFLGSPLNPNNVLFTINSTNKIKDGEIVSLQDEDAWELPF